MSDEERLLPKLITSRAVFFFMVLPDTRVGDKDWCGHLWQVLFYLFYFVFCLFCLFFSSFSPSQVNESNEGTTERVVGTVSSRQSRWMQEAFRTTVTRTACCTECNEKIASSQLEVFCRPRSETYVYFSIWHHTPNVIWYPVQDVPSECVGRGEARRVTDARRIISYVYNILSD